MVREVCTVELHLPLTLVIPIANYLDRFGLSGPFVKDSVKPNFLDITGYQIKYSTVL